MIDTSKGKHTEVFRGTDGEFLAARWHDVIVLFYLAQETDANLQAFRAWSQAAGRANPGGSVTAVWIDAYGARHPPSASARAFYSKFTEEREPQVGRRCYIVDCDGFAGATARAVLTGMALLTRKDVPIRVVRDPLDGMRWLCEHPSSTGRGTPEEALAFFAPLIRGWHEGRR